MRGAQYQDAPFSGFALFSSLERGYAGQCSFPAEIALRLEALKSWQVEKGELTRAFELPDFKAALQLVNGVGRAVESANYHPGIGIRYNRVRLALVTHDAGGLTAKDFDLAETIDRIAAK